MSGNGMTFQAIWDQLCRKSSALEKPDSVVEFKADNLKALLRQVYEQGQQSVPRQSKDTDEMKSMFDSMFGGRK